ncbi:NAD(P)-dependent dehydrogenase, short-chain alcohol dehydrogenase family [Andreprevotia lacus DSM 23236]|jgi:NAD(P)-dependent dehydrogenase (short-subunit alcohol dehydrogenase family)|uniref:NAD(P)-dependent dehydrogenase, short-chain alcohol dehydrogenase family n=1 Tax=Andreprevotia lacus DSM 23236 TaxID=1121001 RepID=A0A1W1XZJ0_9NEIS|nr:short chain dehydrogenase [Andreprevotia lacus]SMC29336.1 NAD(P)-dependent dehydrogenase, short-chain alcohol dehydrogenase family [Andreprevotia lacus DSM 23236]
MKIVIIGAGGTIGQAVVAELGARHDIISAGRNSGDVRVDLKDYASVQQLFRSVGAVDAVIATAGNVHFGPLGEFTPEQYAVGLNDKLMGQVNLVLAGQHVLNDGGSFTLTSGILTHDPIRYGSGASMANAAIDGFVRAAAIELPRGLRINAVSPNVLVESLPAYGAYFRGFDAVPAARVALAYSKSAEGAQTGQVYAVH